MFKKKREPETGREIVWPGEAFSWKAGEPPRKRRGPVALTMAFLTVAAVVLSAGWLQA